jgi:hypothetical protein
LLCFAAENFGEDVFVYLETTMECRLYRPDAARGIPLLARDDLENAFEGRIFDREKELRFLGPASGGAGAWLTSEAERYAEAYGPAMLAAITDRRYYLLGEWDHMMQDAPTGVFSEGRYDTARLHYPLPENPTGLPRLHDRYFIIVREYRKTKPRSWDPADVTDPGDRLSGPFLIGNRFIGAGFGRDGDSMPREV